MTRLLAAIRALLRDLGTPSTRDESAYLWALIGTAHAVAGDAAAGAVIWLLPITPLDAAALVPVLYLIAKEGRDVRRGGMLSDSLVDTCFVALGAAGPLLSLSPSMFHMAVLVASFGGAAIRAAVNNRKQGG